MKEARSKIALLLHYFYSYYTWNGLLLESGTKNNRSISSEIILEIRWLCTLHGSDSTLKCLYQRPLLAVSRSYAGSSSWIRTTTNPGIYSCYWAVLFSHILRTKYGYLTCGHIVMINALLRHPFYLYNIVIFIRFLNATTINLIFKIHYKNVFLSHNSVNGDPRSL